MGATIHHSGHTNVTRVTGLSNVLMFSSDIYEPVMAAHFMSWSFGISLAGLCWLGRGEGPVSVAYQQWAPLLLSNVLMFSSDIYEPVMAAHPGQVLEDGLAIAASVMYGS
jgi:hypothetical protein